MMIRLCNCVITAIALRRSVAGGRAYPHVIAGTDVTTNSASNSATR